MDFKCFKKNWGCPPCQQHRWEDSGGELFHGAATVGLQSIDGMGREGGSK
ncbi:hypothetical protein L195_g005846 [Trifolium pratense]|uniref:Uncharacterized protein n=1 Tax=Trifolium pratense TaxID=57577 RepID=A0A2K3P1X8_TRIPR|nr:hypothetical protein L195_g005846 [Trifolium pratense]